MQDNFVAVYRAGILAHQDVQNVVVDIVLGCVSVFSRLFNSMQTFS